MNLSLTFLFKEMIKRQERQAQNLYCTLYSLFPRKQWDNDPPRDEHTGSGHPHCANLHSMELQEVRTIISNYRPLSL